MAVLISTPAHTSFDLLRMAGRRAVSGELNDPALPQEFANGEVALIPGMGYNAGGVDKVGFVLIALGVAVVVGYAAIAFFTAVAVPLWLRIAISAVVLGLLLVLVSALWERRKVSAEESFREVKR